MSNKTSDNNVATEEDIKVLRNIKKLKRIKFKHYVTEREEQAIENFLSDYTRQKQINEEHRKLNGELREKVKELDTKNDELLKDLYSANCIISDLTDSIPKQAVIDTINENGFEVYTRAYGNIEVVSIDVLQELLETK